MAEAAQAYHKRIAVAALARYAARKAVKRQIQAQGLKLAHYSLREITILANEYMQEHRAEIIAEARELCAKLESDAQAEKARKSRTSAVQMSGSKLEGGK